MAARAAAAGRRDHIELTDTTPALVATNAKAVLLVTPAGQLIDTRSLDEAENIIRNTT